MEKWKQESLFPEEDQKEEEKEELLKKDFLKGLAFYKLSNEDDFDQKKKIRKNIYSLVYNFKEINSIIDFLIKLEFEDKFSKTEYLVLLLEMAFANLKEDISSINDFKDLFKLNYNNLLIEFKNVQGKRNSYLKKINDFISQYGFTTEEEQNNLILLIENYFDNSEILEHIKNLEGNDLKKQEEIFSLMWKARKKKPSSVEEYIQELEGKNQAYSSAIQTLLNTKGTNIQPEFIKEIKALLNGMEEETNSKYFEFNFINIDYLLALKFLNAGLYQSKNKGIEILNESGQTEIKEDMSEAEIQEAIQLNKYFEEGLLILKDFIQNNESRKQEEIFDIDPSLNLNEEEQIKFAQTVKRKLFVTSPLQSQYFIDEQVKEFYEFNDPARKVNYSYSLVNNKGNYKPEYSPIVTSVFSWYDINGKFPFSLNQLYSIYSRKNFKNEAKSNIKTMEFLENALDEMASLRQEITFFKPNGEIEKKENYFLPLAKYTKIKKVISHGKEIEVKQVYYNFIARPPLYDYAKEFEESGMIRYIDDLSFIKTSSNTERLPLDENGTNVLIEQMLIRRIDLMKAGKIGNRLSFNNFFDDYCGINYSTFSDKKKQTFRHKIEVTLNLFKKNSQIIAYRPYFLKTKKNKIQGYEILF